MSKTDKKEERLVAADDDKVPHLENMANVQGSNKHAKDVEQEASSQNASADSL